jgi:pyruvate formate lyase activating enzyme
LAKKILVSNVQRYCIHDGKGIRSTVFLKGCPLRCYWCSNPENQEYKKQLMHYKTKCTGCGWCEKACPNGVINMEAGRPKIDREKCLACGKCTKECLFGALKISGMVTRITPNRNIIVINHIVKFL